MKAKIKKTGEIVNIAEHATVELEMCDSYGNPVCLEPEDIELIQEQTEDEHWQEVRERAAIAAMQGTITLLSNSDVIPSEIPNEIAQFAVACANSLIEELKKK